MITPEFHGTRTNALAAAGVRVHVSDASPRGFSGRVTAVHADALTVARDDTGAWELGHLVPPPGDSGERGDSMNVYSRPDRVTQ